MKVFFSLIVFCLMLITCEGCYVVPIELQAPPGQHVPPNTCIDRFNEEAHLFGSTWIAEDCFKCTCNKDGMHCCHRDVKERPGCKSVLNQVTCEYEFYRLDDPAQRCDV